MTTQAFVGDAGQLRAIRLARVEWQAVKGRQTMLRCRAAAFRAPADLVLLAMGFVHPVREGLLQDLGVGRMAVQCAGERAGLSDFAEQGVQRGRYAPWSVAGRLGNPRRPAVCAGG